MITTIFSAKEAKNNFGRLLDEARLSPVAVVMSMEEYNEFESRRDAYWGRRAQKAHKKGYIGVTKSLKLLNDALNARD